ncbi:MAG: hypothetical protein M3277_03875 [Actinomycetota bacterium]|nr:hypothetical protein [Actinomycetota bacterium]
MRLVGLALCAALVGCAGGEGSATPKVCSQPTPTRDLQEPPPDVPIDDYGTQVEGEVADDYLNAKVVSEDLIVEIDPSLQRSLVDAGYEIIGHDNEGFEAEIFFRRGADTVGTIFMKEGPCDGQVTIDLLYTTPSLAEER